MWSFSTWCMMCSRESICSVILLYGMSTKALSCGLKSTSSPLSVASTMRLVPRSSPLTTCCAVFIGKPPGRILLNPFFMWREALPFRWSMRCKTERREDVGHELAQPRASRRGVAVDDGFGGRGSPGIELAHDIDDPLGRCRLRRRG